MTEPDRVGLCASCVHSRVIENKRGSTFWRCSRSETDARFPKYPQLPIRECDGYEKASEAK